MHQKETNERRLYLSKDEFFTGPFGNVVTKWSKADWKEEAMSDVFNDYSAWHKSFTQKGFKLTLEMEFYLEIYAKEHTKKLLLGDSYTINEY